MKTDIRHPLTPIQAFVSDYDDACKHWSRRFEYPWVLYNGDFKWGQLVLDAAGGDAPLQMLMARVCSVVNVDLDKAGLERAEMKYRHDPVKANVSRGLHDLTALPFRQVFDRVVCVSVLEHCARPDLILEGLWSVLKPGGKLLASFDVADYARHNHTIDRDRADALLNLFGVGTIEPQNTENVLTAQFPELDPGPGEPEVVHLRVVCLVAEKGPATS